MEIDLFDVRIEREKGKKTRSQTTTTKTHVALLVVVNLSSSSYPTGAYITSKTMAIAKISIVTILAQVIGCSAASISALVNSARQRHSFSSLPLGFTVRILEKEEREKGGLWVDISNDETTDCDYDFDEAEAEDDDCDCDEMEKVKPTRISVPNAHGPLQAEATKEIVEEEHPMRTDEWLVTVNLSPLLLPGNSEAGLFPDFHDKKKLAKRSSSKKRKHQVIKFAKNGYVVLVEGDDDTRESETDGEDLCESNGLERNGGRVTKIGKWKIDTSGVSWTIPVKSPDSPSKRTILYYHADIHLSKFQEQPRMFRGVVTRDHFDDLTLPGVGVTIRKSLFRPVIATFTAEGIGTDTADISYKSRGFGLSKGNA